eukprot:11894127-Alexandrium_andersonii.AAC.1
MASSSTSALARRPLAQAWTTPSTRKWTDLVAYQDLVGLSAAGPCSRTQESASMGTTAVSPAPA